MLEKIQYVDEEVIDRYLNDDVIPQYKSDEELQDNDGGCEP